jgi:GAF domain-containing protein
MASFRGTDECLEEEIATLEAIARLRVRRYARELKEVDHDLAELRAERARRRVCAQILVTEVVEVES